MHSSNAKGLRHPLRYYLYPYQPPDRKTLDVLLVCLPVSGSLVGMTMDDAKTSRHCEARQEVSLVNQNLMLSAPATPHQDLLVD